jgi:hypothetical protein
MSSISSNTPLPDNNISNENPIPNDINNPKASFTANGKVVIGGKTYTVKVLGSGISGDAATIASAVARFINESKIFKDISSFNTATISHAKTDVEGSIPLTGTRAPSIIHTDEQKEKFVDLMSSINRVAPTIINSVNNNNSSTTLANTFTQNNLSPTPQPFINPNFNQPEDNNEVDNNNSNENSNNNSLALLNNPPSNKLSTIKEKEGEEEEEGDNVSNNINNSSASLNSPKPLQAANNFQSAVDNNQDSRNKDIPINELTSTVTNSSSQLTNNKTNKQVAQNSQTNRNLPNTENQTVVNKGLSKKKEWAFITWVRSLCGKKPKEEVEEYQHWIPEDRRNAIGNEQEAERNKSIDNPNNDNDPGRTIIV